MTQLLLNAYPAKPSTGGGISVIFHLNGTPDPFPSRIAEIKTTAHALAALEDYKAEATATGLPMAITMKIYEGRKPNGFKKATADMPYYHRVNV